MLCHGNKTCTRVLNIEARQERSVKRQTNHAKCRMIKERCKRELDNHRIGSHLASWLVCYPHTHPHSQREYTVNQHAFVHNDILISLIYLRAYATVVVAHERPDESHLVEH
jgi:hypothetical protein